MKGLEVAREVWGGKRVDMAGMTDVRVVQRQLVEESSIDWVDDVAEEMDEEKI